MKQAQTALITGATGGIGRALCCEFARRGHSLILSGRNPARLRGLAQKLTDTYGVDVYPIAANLGVKGAARELCARLDRRGAQVDVLVNNAGFGRAEYFADSTPNVQREMLYVNIHAATDLCRHFLPGMLERGEGRILNTASIGAFVPGPGNALYCASKAFVLSLSQALFDECRGTGVTVTALCPGATHSGFAHRAGMETSLLFNGRVMSPRQVAQDAYRGLMAGKAMVIPGGQNKLVYLLCKAAPSRLSARLSGVIQRPMATESGPEGDAPLEMR